MSIDDKLRNINLDMDISFTGSLFILQDFISSNDIMDFQIYNILDIWSGKICTLNKYKEYPRDALFMLIYLSIMLYNDLANPEIKNKMNLKKFIQMTNGLLNNKNFPEDFITEIYNNIYNKINGNGNRNRNDNIKSKKTCIIL